MCKRVIQACRILGSVAAAAVAAAIATATAVAAATAFATAAAVAATAAFTATAAEAAAATTAIATTVAGLRQKVGKARILAVLEPRSNTMKLGSMKAALPESLQAADQVFCYAGDVDWDVAEALAPLGEKLHVGRDFEDFVAEIVHEAKTGDHILVMSNGGFGGIYDLTSETSIDAGIFRSKQNLTSTTNYKMNTYGVGVQHKFLKDLTAYAQYASVKNNGTATAAFNFAGPTIEPGSLTVGQKAKTLNLGVLYAFF